MFEKILLGVDVGSNSVGWCLTDENNNIIKKNGKSLWGVRLFDSIENDKKSSAKVRREFRNNRRRLKRRKERIELLQMLFAKPMFELDKTFFTRLNESFYLPEDRKIQFDYTLFNDRNYKDSDFYKEYPTIYHLRNHLIESKEKEDLRFIYLALHHMIKYRGNFLLDVNEFKPMNDAEAENLFSELKEQLIKADYPVVTYNTEIFKKLKSINNKDITITKLKEKFNEFLNPNNEKELKNFIIPFIAGAKISLKKLEIEVDNIDKISTNDENIEETLFSLIDLKPDKQDILNVLITCVKIYQFFLLGRLLGGNENNENKYLSTAMVEIYENHRKELKELKKYIKDNIPEKYNQIFKDPIHSKKEIINNYAKYIGSNNSNGVKKRFSHVSQKEFYNFLKKTLNLEKNENLEQDPFLKEINIKIDNKTYLNKQNSPSNGLFPYQLNALEMKIILENQSKYYPFLKEKDNDGLTTIDKIISILKFKIPYYVGPLASPNSDDERTKYAWVKRTKEKIYPWNFDKVVDKDASAEAFIRRMLNHCTYLPTCNCLPLNSIIFSYYNLLSFLNKIAVNGEILSRDEKLNLIHNVFAKKRKVNKKDIIDYFKIKYQVDASKINITSSNGKSLDELNCSMASYVDFVNIFGEKYVKENINLIEKIFKILLFLKIKLF